MHAFLTPAGGTFEQRVATAPELDVGIDRTPSNAVGILCQPRAVAPGKPFVVNIWFTQTHPRESDLIAVALVRIRVLIWVDGCAYHRSPTRPSPDKKLPNNQQHADSKEYFGGCQHAIKEQQGHISCNFDLHPAALDAPLKFKAWISPRGMSVGWLVWMDGWTD
jgi:hypothetical protein